MVAPYPDSRARRVEELRSDLEREIVALLPDLARPAPQDEFGDAFYELALRMAAQITSRLARTPRRDALAFFDALDIPPLAPRPAEAPLVFTLAEKRQEPVVAPERFQVGADAEDGEEMVFETLEKVNLTPARLRRLLSVDLGADRIEDAPATVLSAEPPAGPFPQYQLATFADVGSTTIQVTPVEGLAEGDLIRIGSSGGEVHRIESIERDICTLGEGLSAPADKGTPVVKVTIFQAFALRDVQAHQVYIGHAELLNLERRALITLLTEPRSVLLRLAGMNLTASIWAKDKTKGAKEPDWRELTLGEAGPNGLSFLKTFEGETEKLELFGLESRWLRLTLEDPIPNAAEVGTRVSQLFLRIASRPLEDAAAQAEEQQEGSSGVSRAFHNSTPLPLATRFLPFGPEPQRFDTFSLAAPEAFSKKDAIVTLAVSMVDATLLALQLAAIETGPVRAYGVGRNGRLQAFSFAGPRLSNWQEFKTPEGGDGDPAAALLSQKRPPQAVEIATVGGQPRDLVVSWDRNDRPWARTTGAGQDPTPAAWQPLPRIAADPNTDEPVQDLTVVRTDPDKVAGFVAAVLALTAEGLYALGVNSSGSFAGNWRKVDDAASASLPQLSSEGEVSLVPVQGDDWPTQPRAFSADILLIDTAGAIFRGAVDLSDPAGFAVTWAELKPAETATPAFRPAAAETSEGILLVAATPDAANGVGPLLLIAGSDWSTLSSDPLPQPPEFHPLGGSAAAILRAEHAPGVHQLLIAALGASQSGVRIAALWDADVDPNTNVATATLIPADGLARSVNRDQYGVVWVPQPHAPPLLVVGGKDETLQRASFDNRTKITFELYDRVVLSGSGGRPNFLEVRTGESARILPLPPAKGSANQPILNGDSVEYYAVSQDDSLQEELSEYRFLRRKDPLTLDATGELEGDNSDRLELAEDVTEEGDLLIVGDSPGNAEIFEVKSIDVGPPRVATLNRAVMAPGGSVSYSTVTIRKAWATVEASDLGTLVKVVSSAQPVKALAFGAEGADPPLQQVAEHISGGQKWLVIATAWSTQPTRDQAEVVRDVSFGAWSAEPLGRGYNNPDLSWEYFDGRGWERLILIADETHDLATSGDIKFEVPSDLAETEIGGQQDYWIRARLIGGDYGRARYVVKTEGVPPTTTQSVTIDTSNLHPPEILRIEASYSVAGAAPEQVLVDNNAGVLDQTQAAAEPNAQFELFEGLLALDRFGADAPIHDRAVFLGFNRSFKVVPLSLFADVEEQEGEGALRAAVLTQRGWSTVTVIDRTGAFRRSGFLWIFVDEPPILARLFGDDLFWLRLAPEAAGGAPGGPWAPRIKGLYVNAVAAEQARTITQELLGSSIGEPDQVYRLAETPVVIREGAVQRRASAAQALDVEIRVREALTFEERAQFEAEGGPVPAVVSPADLPGDWVLWRRADSFIGEGAEARIFKLDPVDGTLTFGNGTDGKIPPPGRDSIRAFHYQHGGGTKGNVGAHRIKNLKTALESVELVTNPVEAGGGTDTPGADRLLATAPERLRHASRALSPADMEAFAVASSPDVVRAKCIPPRAPSDPIRIAVAVRTGQRCPRPSIARRKGLAQAIRAHAAGALEAEAIEVVAPDYVAVKVNVRLLATSAEGAGAVENEAREKLLRLLHPVEGGPQQNGWPFGRRVWQSDIAQALAGMAGVDRLVSVHLEPVEAGVDLERLPPTALICAEEKDVTVRVEPGEGP